MTLGKNTASAGLALMLLTSFLGSGCGQSTGVTFEIKAGGLAAGDKAAEFKLLDQNRKLVKSSDVKPGWWTVLVFYRGRWCMACQNQLMNLKQGAGKFAENRISLAAVSNDPVEEAEIFHREWRMPFPLLSDVRMQLIDAYGLRFSRGDGKDFSKSAVIIIDPDRIIRKKIVEKNPPDCPSNDEIVFLVNQLKASSRQP